jgi:hypothetical protein
MPIDINNIRADRGGDPEKWREYCRKRNKPAELVDRVVDLDAVRDIWVWEGGKRRGRPHAATLRSTTGALCEFLLPARE